MNRNNDYTAGNLLDYFSENYRLIATDLRKKTELKKNHDLKQKINFIGKLKEQKNGPSMFFIVYSVPVTYELQSESTLYICLNLKELLAQSRRAMLG